MSGVVSTYQCDECRRTGLQAADMGKFCGTAANCGVCRACLRRMEGPAVSRLPRGTNRTPPKKRRKKR